MPVRMSLVSRALASFGALTQHLGVLTEEEVLAALDLESATSRRQSVIDRLLSRAVRLNEVRYSSQLKEKYHGKKDSDPR